MKRTTFLLMTIICPGLLYGENNSLLRSGSMAQFGETKIYTAEGIQVSAGVFEESFFAESKRLSTALASAGGENPAVAPGWQTTSEFEEWIDRLVLKRTTTFTLLNGSRFHSEHFTGTAFTPHAGITPDPSTPPEMLALAEAYIADGDHLLLYPAARTAGGAGGQALLNELAKDKGPVISEESIEFSRIVPELQDPASADVVMGSIVKFGPVEGAGLSEQLRATERAGFKNFQLPENLETPVRQDLDESVTYTQEMLNGFTIGNTWSKKISYSRSWMSFETSAFATFGIGIRIPWEATVEVGPRLIPKGSSDKTPYTANLSIQTLDADEIFYERVGLPDDHLYDGQEAVLRAGAGITLKLVIFGDTIINRTTTNPLVGEYLDLGRDFDPPLGTTLNVASPELLYEQSGLAYQHWAFGIGGDFKAEIGITGQDFELIAEPHNGWTKTDSEKYSKSSRTVTVTNENSAKSLEFACDDSSQISKRQSGGSYYRHGVIFSGADYHTSLDVTPKARVRATLKLSNMLPGLSDVNLSSPWIDLFTASFDLPALGPHDDTEGSIEAYSKNKRELSVIQGGDLTREWELNLSDNKWRVEIGGLLRDVTEVIEYLPDNVVVESISDGGLLDPAAKTITWISINGESLEDVSYELTTGDSVLPNVVGQSRSQNPELISGIRSFGNDDGDEALLKIRNLELAKRPTFEELLDGRPKSKIYQAEDGKVRLQLKFQSSGDLKFWTDEVTPMDYEFTMPEGRRYFRFGMD